METIYADKLVVTTVKEKKQIFEAFVLKIYVSWELLVQGILIDCLNRDTSQYAKHTETPLPKHLSRNVCKALLKGLGYFPRPADIKKTAKNILVPRHNPFGAIPESAARKMKEFRTIRNYLAHYSDSSRTKLKTMYKRNYNLKHFQEPGDFLFRQFGRSRPGGKIRFATYIKSFFDAADAMASFLSV